MKVTFIVLALALAASAKKYCALGCAGCLKDGTDDRYYRACRHCTPTCPSGYHDFTCAIFDHCQSVHV